ncbi:MAG TPA: hypothetical protein VH637_13110 [Streptosporangiaceae bacterium]
MRTGAIVLAAGAAIALAGCGGSSGPASSVASATAAPANGKLTADAIIAQLKTAMKNANSVHVAGTVTDSGTSDSLDLAMTTAGSLSGTISSAGTKLEIIEAGSTAYIKVTNGFLKLAHAPAGVCAKFCGKYVATSQADSKQITGDLSLTKLLQQITQSMPKFTKVGTTTVNGQQAVVLHGNDGSILDVAGSGPPYPLRAIAPKSSNEGQLDFTDWNAVPAIAAPPASQVISLSQLAG